MEHEKAAAEVLEAAAAIEGDDIWSIRSSISPSIIKQQTEAHLDNHVHVSFKHIIDSPGTSSPIGVRKPSLSKELPETSTEYHASPTKPGYSLLFEYQPATGQHPFFPQYTTSHAHHTFKASRGVHEVFRYCSKDQYIAKFSDSISSHVRLLKRAGNW